MLEESKDEGDFEDQLLLKNGSDRRDSWRDSLLVKFIYIFNFLIKFIKLIIKKLSLSMESD